MKNSLRVQSAIKDVLAEMRKLSVEEFQQELKLSIDGEFAQILDKSRMFEDIVDCDVSESTIHD